MSARRRGVSPAASAASPPRTRFYVSLVKTMTSIQYKIDEIVTGPPQEAAPTVTVVDHVWTQLLLHYPHIGKVASFSERSVLFKR